MIVCYCVCDSHHASVSWYVNKVVLCIRAVWRVSLRISGPLLLLFVSLLTVLSGLCVVQWVNGSSESSSICMSASRTPVFTEMVVICDWLCFYCRERKSMTSLIVTICNIYPAHKQTWSLLVIVLYWKHICWFYVLFYSF